MSHKTCLWACFLMTGCQGQVTVTVTSAGFSPDPSLSPIYIFYRPKSHNAPFQNWRETAQIQIREFNASRRKQLENLMLISETSDGSSSAPAPLTKEDQFSNIIELIDLQQDSNDGVDRSRLRQVLLKMKQWNEKFFLNKTCCMLQYRLSACSINVLFLPQYLCCTRSFIFCKAGVPFFSSISSK